ncbi:ABC transporter permease [Bifidobacterium sp. W8108]|uniref:ABC transporter permease n=1 Tax=unclassified Bifidobacterium TaxID=2608897 RepID=UPI0018DE4FAC|nr:ABC transporter permease [Bifidobacterium sp. W8108]MBI0172860.1 ABC transporter permease [Bifidobacterium sp. M0307]
MRRTSPRPGWTRLLAPTLTLVALLVIWEAAVRLGGVSDQVLPSPSQIAQATFDSLDDLIPATAITGIEGLLGFLLATALGLVIGLAIHAWRTLHDAIYPLIAGAQMIPLITIAPLFIIWFGFEPLGKVVIVAIFALFPIVVQTCRGLDAVPRFYQDVALNCGATKAWALWHVKLRVAARQIFGGLRISAAYVFATAATSEYLGAQSGLGIWLQSAFNSFRTPLIFSATLVIVILTAALLALITLVERLLLGAPEKD